jgi:heterodisulfide reductase subunit C
MAEPATVSKEKAVDVGIEKGVEKLTPEKIEKVIDRVLKGETGARLKTYVDTCVHCGLCSEACHYYLSHDNDPAYSPAGKVKQTIWEILKKKGKVSPPFIKEACEIAFTECNLCRRCAMYCPFGIDVAYLILVMRRICHMLGVTPQYSESSDPYRQGGRGCFLFRDRP